jgi:hypothetical protein
LLLKNTYVTIFNLIYTAQRFIIKILENPEQLATLEKAITIVNKTLLPKLTTLIVLWKN